MKDLVNKLKLDMQPLPNATCAFQSPKIEVCKIAINHTEHSTWC